MSHASLLILLLFASSAPAQEWARFRGPGGAGVAPEADIPSIFTMDDVAWKITLPGKGHSSPVVWKDRLWVTCEGSEPGKRSLVCLSPADGSVRWNRELTFEPHDQHRFNSSASATPAVDAEGVYVFWTSGDRLIASAFDHDGEPSWTRELGRSTAQHGSGASPVVVNGVLLVGNDHEGEGSALFGLRCSDGKTIWKRERDSTRASYATPLVRRTAAGTEAIFASTSHGVTSLDPKTGNLNWETDASFKQRFVGSPAIADGVLFASAGSGGGGKESIAIALPDGPTKKAPEILYRARRRLPYVTTPIGVGERFFLIADGGFASCVDARSGDEIWNQRLDGSFYCSPVCVGDRIYVVSRSGELFVIAARDEFKLESFLKLKRRIPVTPSRDRTQYKIEAIIMKTF